MMKKTTLRGIAVFFALNILFEVLAPTVALALTSGPGQPEMEAFEPIATTEMVDPFSGDFNYNIPLMTVPGPNGGYPLNLSYHAGIGMEQEASWVGLGWNINVGEISRQMRGLPDDFNGDQLTKEMFMKPNRSASLNAKFSLELMNMDTGIGTGLSLSTGLLWNSYKGIGFSQGQGVSLGQANGAGLGINTNYNSFSGDLDLSASISYSKTQDLEQSKYGLSFSFSSNEGAKQISFNQSKRNFYYTGNINEEGDQQRFFEGSSGTGAGVSFSSSSYVPHSEMPRTGFSVGASMDLGTDIWGLNPGFGTSIFYSQDKIDQNILTMKGFGYLYSEGRKSLSAQYDNSLMDFNREKDFQITKDIPAIASPVFTNDIYFAKGQGVGGAFRPYRSDIGVLHDPVVKSKNIGVNIGQEVGTGSTLKVASDITASYSKSYSGPWRDEDTWAELQTDYEFKGKVSNDPLFEPFYFRSAGDMTANIDETASGYGATSAALPLNMGFGISIGDFSDPSIDEIEQPLADVTISKGGLGNAKYSQRASRAQTMYYKTNSQLDQSVSSSVFSKRSIYTENDFPRNPSTQGDDPDYSAHAGHHLGEITVINPDGNRYVYGIAAYNISQREVSFSVDHNHADNDLYSFNLIVDYTTTDASYLNQKGDDNFYTAKYLPEYAHSYLLTAIVSPDYVDLTGNGLTEDDYGYWVKFNYTKLTNDIAWRAPFKMASFIDGYTSISSDDKAGYTYGTKEIWYLNSVETKTHIAEFKLSNRRDGFGPYTEHNGIGNTTPIVNTTTALKKLDRIDLYSKNDASYSTGSPVPIKTVLFEYNYDLCGDVENNSGSSESFNDPLTGTPKEINGNHGKLTLKKIWFTHLNNNKGLISPYVFDYHESNSDENPDFSTLKVDRWGNYKDNINPNMPYVDQKDSYANRSTHAGAWNLKEILLPSGGKIKVEYESDDYAYVQNHETMQMSKIVGVSGSPGLTTVIGESNIKGDDLFVYFELKSQNIGYQFQMYPYVKNISDLYFKTYQKLKKDLLTGTMKSDYVTGYAKVGGGNSDGSFILSDSVSGYGFVTISGTKYGYLKLGKINVHDKPMLSGLDFTNPFRKAGWQYLKLNRPDLLYPSSNNNAGTNPTASALFQLAYGVVGYFTSNIQMFAGYYNYCIINNFCNALDYNANYPSIIRLNTPDKIKFGGGHRVKSIRITNTWAGLPSSSSSDADYSEYGQEYFYRMPDGSSSGVAAYEPMIGGEEISLRKPVRYSSDYLITKHDDLYLEEPYCESYYPAANVGYSRVIVKGIDHGIQNGAQGINVYEYYTAKDFPVIVEKSQLEHEKFTPDISIPFIGSVSFENHGFSQTYTVETNDMHGKPKSQATYAYGTDLMTSNALAAFPVLKTEFIYKTDAPYSSNSKNHLNNQVDVLYEDGYYKSSNLGLTKEFFIDMRERSTVSMVNGGQINFELNFYPPVPVFAFVPYVSYSEQLNKMASGMNVIGRNGILIETRNSKGGATAISKNLMFDGSTGKPLLTQVTNNFDKPVYTYDFAAHWAYDGMASAYKNIGATFNVNVSSGAGLFIGFAGSPINYLVPGDEVLLVPVTSGTTYKA